MRELDQDADRLVDEAMRVSSVRQAADADPEAVIGGLADTARDRLATRGALGRWQDRNAPVLEAHGWRDPNTGKFAKGPPGARGKLKAIDDEPPGSLAPRRRK